MAGELPLLDKSFVVLGNSLKLTLNQNKMINYLESVRILILQYVISIYNLKSSRITKKSLIYEYVTGKKEVTSD